MRGKKILNHDTVSSAQYLGGRVILPIQGLKQFHNATAKNKNTLMIFTCNYVDLKNVQYRSLAIVMTETDPKQADVYICFPTKFFSQELNFIISSFNIREVGKCYFLWTWENILHCFSSHSLRQQNVKSKKCSLTTTEISQTFIFGLTWTEN